MVKKVLFIGAPGNIATHAVNEACKLGFEVAVFKRTNVLDEDLRYPVELILGDRDNRKDLERALEEFTPDVVVDFACFRAYQAELISDVLDGKVEQYIFVSSVDYYGFPLKKLPWKEEYGVSGPYPGEYAISKGECEDVFMRKHREEQFPVTIARPCYSIHKKAVLLFFYGRDWNNEGGRTMIERLRANKPIIVPGDGTTLIQPGVARNHGRMIAWMIGQSFAIGEAYNCVHDDVITMDEYVKLFAKAVGVEPRIVHIPTDVLMSLGIKEIEMGYAHVLIRYHSYYSTDKFVEAFPDFKWEYTTEDAIREYIDWNEKQGLFKAVPDETVEDRVAKAWFECIKELRRKV